MRYVSLVHQENVVADACLMMPALMNLGVLANDAVVTDVDTVP
jgi:hypothetical protein